MIDQTLLVNNLGDEGVSVEVELYQTKNVPIDIDTSGISAAEGYSIGEISCEPQEVLLSGDEDTMKELDEIQIPESELELAGLTERTERTVDITEYLPDGVTLVDPNANNVVVTIPVNQPGAQVFEVSTNSIVVSNLASNLEVSYGTTVDLELQIRGPEETLQSLTLAKKVSIDLKNYTSTGTYTVPLNVDLPEDCTLASEADVEIILRQKSNSTEDENGRNNAVQKQTE